MKATIPRHRSGFWRLSECSETSLQFEGAASAPSVKIQAITVISDRHGQCPIPWYEYRSSIALWSWAVAVWSQPALRLSVSV
jgi:hypothetical protein